MITAFDNSMLSDFKRCHRFFFYRHILHKISKKQNFDADFKAQFGVAWHLAMDIWYTIEDAEASDNAFINHWIDFEGLDQQEIRTMVNGLSYLERYRDYYPIIESKYKIIKELTEVGFSIAIDDYIYCGRIDKIAEQYGELIIIDHKTSGRKGYLCLDPNDALTGYIFGMSEIMGKQLRRAKLDQVYIYKGKKLDNEIFIQEDTVRADWQLDEWRNEVIRWMTFVNVCEKQNKWNKNVNNCHAFGRPCEYKALCKAKPGSERDAILRDFFKDEVWIPYPDKSLEYIKGA